MLFNHATPTGNNIETNKDKSISEKALSMKLLLQLVGIGLLLVGIYFLGQNIFVTTEVSPYIWQGLLADLSVLFLSLGLLMLVLIPFSSLRQTGLIFLLVGGICALGSDRSVFNWASLSQLVISVFAIASGYLMVATGKLHR